MADRAARQVPLARDVVFTLQSSADFDLVAGGLVGHVEDLIARANVFFRRPVAVDAPAHLQGLRLIHQRHLVHGPVAGVASDALLDVDFVAEVDESGRSFTRVQCSGMSSRKLARTGSKICALVKSTE